MILGEHVRDWVEGGDDGKHHGNDDLLIWSLGFTEVRDVFSDIVGHLWGRCLGAIIILNHTIMELWWHSNNHVIEVWVEVATLWDIMTNWGIVVEASEQVVWVVNVTWLMGSSFGQLWWPHTLVGALGLMHGHVWWPDSVLDLSLTVIPFLEVIRAVLLMSWMNFTSEDHSLGEFHLLETLVHKKIVLLMHGSVATLAGSGEDLETSSQTIYEQES